MSDWIALSEVANWFEAASELEELVREAPIRMLGEFCVDYTNPMCDGRVDATDISRNFLLNAQFNLENNTVTANPNYRMQNGAMNYEMYSFVRLSLSDLASAKRRKSEAPRGRPPKHDWDLIFSVAIEELENWEEGQNKFIGHLRSRLRSEGYAIDLPDPSTLKKKLAPIFNSRHKSPGA
jgi:hypothetical protein